MSKLFREDAVRVVEKATGRKFDMIEQDVDLGCDGKMRHRYNIGINGYHSWTPVEMIYNDDVFYARYDFV